MIYERQESVWKKVGDGENERIGSLIRKSGKGWKDDKGPWNKGFGRKTENLNGFSYFF